MPKKLYQIKLNDEERQALLEMTHKGKSKRAPSISDVSTFELRLSSLIMSSTA